MKNIIKITLLLFSAVCSAQTTVIDILDKDGTRTTGAYYQDTNNLLNTFEGTWLYTNGSTSLKIELVKKIRQYNRAYYEDLIIGEYEYKVNNVVLISTLSEINTIYPNQREHNIDGNSLIKKTTKPTCDDCLNDEKRLELGFIDPILDSYGYMIVKKTTQNGQEAIRIRTKREGIGTPWIIGTPEPPRDFTVPAGEYILIKQ